MLLFNDGDGTMRMGQCKITDQNNFACPKLKRLISVLRPSAWGKFFEIWKTFLICTWVVATLRFGGFRKSVSGSNFCDVAFSEIRSRKVSLSRTRFLAIWNHRAKIAYFLNLQKNHSQTLEMIPKRAAYDEYAVTDGSRDGCLASKHYCFFALKNLQLILMNENILTKKLRFNEKRNLLSKSNVCSVRNHSSDSLDSSLRRPGAARWSGIYNSAYQLQFFTKNNWTPVTPC